MYEAERERVKRYTEQWDAVMGEGMFTFTDNFNESYKEDSVIAETDSENWMYRDIVTTWHLSNIGRLTDLALSKVVVHERVHGLMAPLKEEISDSPYVKQLEELATENIARAIMSVGRARNLRCVK